MSAAPSTTKDSSQGTQLAPPVPRGVHGKNSGSTPASHESVTIDQVSSEFERVLRDYAGRRHKAGVPSRELGVCFRDLTVVGAGALSSYQPTLGSLLNPLNITNSIRASRHPQYCNILSGFEGVVRPGEMLLVLGSPGSGCTTLLKALANHQDEYHAVQGEVHYDSMTPDEMKRRFRGDILYVPEEDIHFPTLTVDQTIDFASKMRPAMPRNPDREMTRFVTDMYETVFGLHGVKDTIIGDAAIRGASGGEKKRVSISEALASGSFITSWDNSTRGLDSSTALEFIRVLRTVTNVNKLTTIVSLYQAGEQLFEVFDKVCVIYEGKQAYFGPAKQAKQYFIDMGYVPANRQTTPDFLVSVTDAGGRITRHGISHPVPRTADEFMAYFKRSGFNRLNQQDMESYLKEFVGKPDRAEAYKQAGLQLSGGTSPYVTSIAVQAREVMKRRVRIIRGNWLVQLILITAFTIQSILIGLMCYQMPIDTSNFFGRGGVIFFAVFMPVIMALAEMPSLFSQRAVILRHKYAALYHPMVEALAMTLVDIPLTFVIFVPFCVILYFLVGFQRTAAQFFIFFLVVFTDAVAMKGLFRTIAMALKSAPPAQTLGGICVMSISLYTGYMIPLPSMIKALKWISYINPVRYAFEALFVNEFHTIHGRCTQFVPSGPGYLNVSLANQVCATVGAVPGSRTVEGDKFIFISFGYLYSHLWRNYGIIVAFALFFISTLLVVTEFNTALSRTSSIILFKRRPRGGPALPSRTDEEKGKSHNSRPNNVDSAEVTEVQKSDFRSTDVFSWHHLSYVIPVGHNGQRRLLDDISGYVAPGKLTALMGETGSGKTTLLNALSERTDTGVVTGDRFVNGQALPRDFRAQTGYVQQTDTHVPTATVREALVFSAMLRQPQSVPTIEKRAFAEMCLKICGLEAYAEAMIGTLNPEYRKRTTIGVELAAKPRLLLFLDEPTTGLDSKSAWAIVSFLRTLADSGQAILCTIHQPSAELFQVFDRLLLLQKGGQTVYFGDLGHHATAMISYFESHGSRPCKPGENPAEFMLDVVGAGATATSDQDWYTIWMASKEAKTLEHEINDVLNEGRLRPPVATTLTSEFATSWFHQVKLLTGRNFISYWRDINYLRAKLALATIAGLFIGFTFFKVKDTIQGSQNKLFAIFMGIILAIPLGQQIIVPLINLRTISEIRERPSRMYHWSALTLSQILVEFPWNILASSLFFICWFWTVGYSTSRAGYTYFLLGVLFPLYYTTLSHATGSMAPTAEIGAILYSFTYFLTLIFGGVVQPFSRLGWWRWMYRLSPITYVTEGLVGQAVGRQQITCAPKELVVVNPPSGATCISYMQNYIFHRGGYLINPNATSGCVYCSAQTTDQFLGPAFNIEYPHHWRDAWFLFGYIAFNVALIFTFTYIFRVQGFKKMFVRIRNPFIRASASVAAV